MELGIKFFPWENGEKPYWIDPENGVEWYIDKKNANLCTRTLNNLPKLDAVLFIVAERKGNEVKPISRVLVDKKTNKLIADETSLEVMGVKIDWLRLVASTKNN